MSVHPDYPDPSLIPGDLPFEHVCEVCKKTESLSSDAAYAAGWDYPPEMGEWGVISVRTCDRCRMTDTVWWAMIHWKKTLDDLTPEQRKTVARILNEVPD
jgi:hypothetical protein